MGSTDIYGDRMVNALQLFSIAMENGWSWPWMIDGLLYSMICLLTLRVVVVVVVVVAVVNFQQLSDSSLEGRDTANRDCNQQRRDIKKNHRMYQES